MELSKKCNHPAFTAKFIPNKAFKEVVDYAAKNSQLRALDSALNTLKKANDGDILIIHGSKNGKTFSNFTMGKRSVVNIGTNSPAEATFNGIIDLASLGRKFRSLVGGEVQEKITVNDIIKNYTSNIQI